jgi:hypothetical protein
MIAYYGQSNDGRFVAGGISVIAGGKEKLDGPGRWQNGAFAENTKTVGTKLRSR